MAVNRNNLSFQMSFQVNEFGEPEAALFIIRKGKSAQTEVIQDGVAYADYDNKGRLLCVELLGPCRVNVLTRLAKSEKAEKNRKAVRTFLRSNIPAAMVAA